MVLVPQSSHFPCDAMNFRLSLKLRCRAEREEVFSFPEHLSVTPGYAADGAEGFPARGSCHRTGRSGTKRRKRLTALSAENQHKP